MKFRKQQQKKAKKPKLMNGTVEKTLDISISPKASGEFIGAYDRWAESLFRFAYFRTPSKEVAQDLVSQTFLKTWDWMLRGNEVQNWRLFLYRTLRNLVIDYYRSKKSHEVVELSDYIKNTFADEFATPEKRNSNLEAKLILEEFSKLDSFSAEVLQLRYIEGLPVKDIAKLVGKTPNAVYVSIHRSLKKISEIYNKNNKGNYEVA
jgi:RNA polymerase sigma-70 factor (ECF subfamily)